MLRCLAALPLLFVHYAQFLPNPLDIELPSLEEKGENKVFMEK